MRFSSARGTRDDRRILEALREAHTGVEAMRASLDDAAMLASLGAISGQLSTVADGVRKQRERLATWRQAVEARSERYQDRFELMPDGYLLTDESGVICDANKAALALLGGGLRKKVIERPLTRFFAAPDRRLLRQQLALFRRNASQDQAEIELTLQPSGRPALPAAVTVAAVSGGDAPTTGFRVLLRDITAHRRLEEAAAAEAANRAKDEFLAMLSHELRNPLHAIIGWSGVLLEETLAPDDLRSALETIDRNGRQLNRLVGDLFDVARIAQHKLVFAPDACDLTAAIAGAYEGVRGELRRRRQRFIVKLHDPGPVRADPARIHQILANLLANAVKFTPDGGAIELHLDSHDGNVEIVIRDTGIGIAPDLLHGIFERFRQGETAPTERGGGLGLGLPIARTLARMHGGDLTAESPGAGLGSVFTVRFPLRRQTEESATAIATRSTGAAATPEQRLPGFHALIVCSDRSAGEAMAQILTLAGARATVVAWPTEAPEQTVEWQADALVVVVPSAPHGARLLAAIAAVESQSNGTLPILAITPSTAAARRWLGLPATVQLCTKGDVAPSLLPSRLALLARISGWGRAL